MLSILLCRIARRRCDWPNIGGDQSTTELISGIYRSLLFLQKSAHPATSICLKFARIEPQLMTANYPKVAAV